jgi:hypothetical protein
MRPIDHDKHILHTAHNAQTPIILVCFIAVEDVQTPHLCAEPDVDKRQRTADGDEEEQETKCPDGDIQIPAPLRGEEECEDEQEGGFDEAGEQRAELRPSFGGEKIASP